MDQLKAQVDDAVRQLPDEALSLLEELLLDERASKIVLDDLEDHEAGMVLTCASLALSEACVRVAHGELGKEELMESLEETASGGKDGVEGR
jgi:hypothetical protein